MLDNIWIVCISLVNKRKPRAHSFSTYSKIFRKTNISYPPVHTGTYVYQGIENVSLSEILRAYKINNP